MSLLSELAQGVMKVVQKETMIDFGHNVVAAEMAATLLFAKDPQGKAKHNTFMLAFVSVHGTFVHELVAQMIQKDHEKPATNEMKLLAALFIHFSDAKVDHPFEAAKNALKALGHEITTEVIPWVAE